MAKYENINQLFDQFIGRKLKPVYFCRAKRHGMNYVFVSGLIKAHFDEHGAITSFSDYGSNKLITKNGITKSVFLEYDLNYDRVENEINNHIE